MKIYHDQNHHHVVNERTKSLTLRTICALCPRALHTFVPSVPLMASHLTCSHALGALVLYVPSKMKIKKMKK